MTRRSGIDGPQTASGFYNPIDLSAGQLTCPLLIGLFSHDAKHLRLRNGEAQIASDTE
jgi:hypothetical protein